MKNVGVGLVMIVLGCGGGSSSVPLDQLPQRSAATVCKRNFTCCDPAELAGKTMSDCMQSNEVMGGFISGAISDAQAKGRAAYNADQMGICLGEIAGLSCAEWKSGKDPAARPSCTAAVTPRVGDGGACQQSFECMSGNCVGSTTDDNGNPVDGACMAAAAQIAAGGACTGPGDACESGTTCDATSLTCQAKKPAGATCASSDECANSCDSTTNTCTCYVMVTCSAAGPVTPRGTLLSLALVGLAIAGVRGRRRV
jgi:hypothetical protein